MDVVNFCGGTMMKHIPTGGFIRTEKTIDEVLDTPDEYEEGYFVMIDSKYSHYLHKNHNNFPLGSQKMKTSEELLSPYQLNFSLKGSSTEKLLEMLFDEKDYICHYTRLKFFLAQGL